MPNTLQIDHREQLEEMIASLEFSDTSADQTSNDDWIVRATHTLSEAPDCFDAGICLVPRNPFQAPVTGVEVAIQRADALGAVRRADALGAVRTEKTNPLGQAWFRGLEPGMYRARLVATSAQGRRPDTSIPIRLAADDGGDTLRLAADSSAESFVCETGDPRVDAIIEKDGAATTITLESRAPELSRAEIHCRIGEHPVSVRLVNGRATQTLEFDLPDPFDGWLDDFRIQE